MTDDPIAHRPTDNVRTVYDALVRTADDTPAARASMKMLADELRDRARKDAARLNDRELADALADRLADMNEGAAADPHWHQETGAYLQTAASRANRKGTPVADASAPTHDTFDTLISALRN